MGSQNDISYPGCGRDGGYWIWHPMDAFTSLMSQNDHKAFEAIEKMLCTKHVLIEMGATTALARNNALQWSLKQVVPEESITDAVALDVTSVTAEEATNTTILEEAPTVVVDVTSDTALEATNTTTLEANTPAK
ncbi:uncharacterized protein [Spinacia oleracea]|uniref:Uncharacterized protein LOC110790209 n=1 Tax=Spinacia oleracea TaxID=3562 RepID=A0A9R0IJW7_SPIOL|nr:uncharacterized protein LOC110790209 isoform X3 [Spinacia oleracea]XP_021850678.1 uncharacterized protein LOC110790209 isoform X3 [Spinacia oleracea]XP_021850680.1 uncharacterized protein LOC110790209 isoform X3 [Spinacia oleracea]XP_021850681.1 uncharacterized protein LOC110790209 isoform X3 [Spinacia oleracea]XP_056684713.1 uncharacterized protein LOC110790209 isoform X3 [Spinacia oleracea]XP_056684714.1 uncharacterized protein LOC110790209 isoform X3 [Spinacia oleracea]XP_056684715.1 un